MEQSLGSILKDKPGELLAVGPNASVSEAARTMSSHNKGCVLVMDEGGLRGLFTERDLMRRVVAEGLDPARTPVNDVMTSEIVTVGPEVTIGEAMSLCTQRRLRHLPIYKDGELLGIVSAGDLTKALVNDKQHTIDDLIGYIYGTEPV
ncbi:CBS domain-containing protein [Gammaproteobacteria bacterium AB-CW1]|uniref:CBS domain-containing protein n=1 Tax=Natronospira elongata TaxID=3110268 RepID=A0AAP6JEJ6_9GAMM|nr:CBS domain-containing protein [Gammaproteobacteria bacterium AB-CW1]